MGIHIRKMTLSVPALIAGALLAFNLFLVIQSQTAHAAFVEPPAAAPAGASSPDSMARPLTATLQNNSQLFLPSVQNLPPPPLGDLTSGWYLMVDDEHIAARDVPRWYHPFQKYAGNPIVRARKTWEGSVIQLYGTVFSDFRMWYSSYNVTWHEGQVLYATSQDGLNWRKPDLQTGFGNALLGGQSANLISVIHTPHDLQRPYKMVIYQNGAFWAYTSQDGVNLTRFSDTPVVNNGQDVAHFSWNAGDRRFYGSAKESVEVNGVRRRAVRLLTSEDFVQWTSLPDLFAPDVLDDQIWPGYFPHFYGMPIFGLGEQQLGLLWVLKARDVYGLHGPVHIQLASSHDGVRWIREEGNRPPILDVGPPGAWDAGQVYTASQPIRVGSELWLYYSGCNLEHGARIADMVCSIGLATLPYLRLASLGGVGSVLTHPLAPTGPALHVNYSAPQGELRVELLRDGAPVPGYEAAACAPLTGDSLDAAVAWNGQTALPEGPFQIRFVMQNASVYAFSLGE